MNKRIPGFPHYYLATSGGFVFSRKCKKGRTLRGFSRSGYVCVSLQVPGSHRIFRVHRLVALAFVPNPGNKPQVNHKNGIKDDNRPENLEWCTQSENTQHAWDTGLSVITPAIELAFAKGRP